MFFGLILIILGVIFLLQNLDIIKVSDVWSIIWPVLLILIGLAVLWKHWWWRRGWQRKKQKIQDIGKKLSHKVKEKIENRE